MRLNKELVMRTTIQDTPAYQLSVDIQSTPLGQSLRLISFVPTARRPEEQVKFQGNFTHDELRALQGAIEGALAGGSGDVPKA
jgi:hypothetical protein